MTNSLPAAATRPPAAPSAASDSASASASAAVPAPGGAVTPPSPRVRRWRSLLLAVIPLACVPYLSLKVTWLSGGTVGIPEGSALRDSGSTLWALNLLTVGMDVTVIVLALALARPWGQRLPAPLMTVPLWGASGLLGPILVAFPLQTLYGVLSGTAGGSGSGGGSAGDNPESMLDGWVWATVYTGFSVQGIALGTLFVLYVRERWGALLRTRLRALPLPARPSFRARAVLVAGALTALPVAVLNVMWAAGSETGLSADLVAKRDASIHIVEATHVGFAVLAVTGTAWLVLRRGNPRLRLPLAAAWAGSGVMACWGGWMLMGAVSGGGRTLGDTATGPMQLTYLVQMLAGLLLAALTARVLTRLGRTGDGRGQESDGGA